MTFRMNAKNYFLTYAQCEVDKEDMVAFLLDLEGDKIKWLVVAHELHEDGGDHLHVQVEYERPRNIRKQDHFDCMGCHPNIQATRRIKDVCTFYSFRIRFTHNYSRWQNISVRTGTTLYTELPRRSSNGS